MSILCGLLISSFRNYFKLNTLCLTCPSSQNEHIFIIGGHWYNNRIVIANFNSISKTATKSFRIHQRPRQTTNNTGVSAQLGGSRPGSRCLPVSSTFQQWLNFVIIFNCSRQFSVPVRHLVTGVMRCQPDALMEHKGADESSMFLERQWREHRHAEGSPGYIHSTSSDDDLVSPPVQQRSSWIWMRP